MIYFYKVREVKFMNLDISYLVEVIINDPEILEQLNYEQLELILSLISEGGVV